MSWLASILGAMASGLSFLSEYFKAKNAPDIRRAEIAQNDDAIDQQNVKQVEEAIQTGDVSKLQK